MNRITDDDKKTKNVFRAESDFTKNNSKKTKFDTRKTRKGVLESPFHMILVGMTASGKTRYLLDLLEKDYMNHFTRIYLLCPTFDWNKTYQEWRYLGDEDFVVVPCDQDNIDEKLKELVFVAKGTNSLIVLDDCASGKSIKNRTSELVKLGFSGRHYGISTVVLTQQLTSVSKPYREQISKIVTFLPSSNKDLKFVLKEYLDDCSEKELEEIKKTLKSVRYARLEIMLRVPQGHVVVTPH